MPTPISYPISGNPNFNFVDMGVLAPILSSPPQNGQPDMSKKDTLSFKANNTALATNVRSVEMNVGNEDAAVTACWPKITGKGNVGLYIPSGAGAPTWAAYMEGSLYYDTATRKLMLATNSAWVIVGTQS